MFLVLIVLLSCFAYVSQAGLYYSSCSESAARACTYGLNTTDRLLSMKKGGSNVLALDHYEPGFFPCEEYNFNCGYVEEQTDFLTVANGVQLNMTEP